MELIVVAVPVSVGVWVGVPARSSVAIPSSDLLTGWPFAFPALGPQL